MGHLGGPHSDVLKQRKSFFKKGFHLTSLVAQMVKHLSTVWETQVQSLGWEDPLDTEMAIHSITIAWKIPWTEEPGRLQSMGSLAKSLTRLSEFTFMAVLGLHCCAGFSVVAAGGGSSLVVMHNFSHGGAGGLGPWASVAGARGLSCPSARGIFPDGD